MVHSMNKILFLCFAISFTLFSCIGKKKLHLKEGSFIFINKSQLKKKEFDIATDSIINSPKLKEHYKRKHKRLNRVGKHRNINIEVNITTLLQDSLNKNGIYYFQTELIDFPNRAVHVRGLSIHSYWIFIKINNQVYFHPKEGYLEYKQKLIKEFSKKEIQKLDFELKNGFIRF